MSFRKIMAICFLVFSIIFLSVASCLGQVKTGVGLTFESGEGLLGVQQNTVFSITEHIKLAPKLAVFFVNYDDRFTTANTISALNLDIHYTFQLETEPENDPFDTDPPYFMYAFSGINFATGSLIEDGSSAFGLNIGLGGELQTSDYLAFFTEVKYVFSTFNRFVAVFGIRTSALF